MHPITPEAQAFLKTLGAMCCPICHDVPSVSYEFNGVTGLCLVCLLVMHDDAQGADVFAEESPALSAPALSAAEEHDRQEDEADREDAADVCVISG